MITDNCDFFVKYKVNFWNNLIVADLVCLQDDVGAAALPVDHSAEEPLYQDVGQVLPTRPGHLTGTK